MISTSRVRYTGVYRKFRDKIMNTTIKILFRKNDGCYITEEDWDHLIILDACRYDMFEKEIRNWEIDGQLEYRISRGASTVEFLLENFSNGNFRDIVYVTANPYVSIYLKEKFYKIIPVWDFGWNEKLNTVPPDATYDAALNAILKYNEKKYIIHFMQPHQPFIRLNKFHGTGFSKLREAAKTGGSAKLDVDIWQLLKKGKVNRDIVLQGYIDNLKLVMPYVVKLCQILQGKVVITSDHGNAIGENLHPLIPIKIYGHPHGRIRIEALVKVPWFVTEGKGDFKLLESELIQQKTRKIKNRLRVKK